jgi:hypothetical protein
MNCIFFTVKLQNSAVGYTPICRIFQDVRLLRKNYSDKMAKTFILHDESVNTQGFRMLVSGADFSVFKENPVMLLNHDSWSMPIGRWENVRVEGSKILADAVFDEKDERSADVAGRVERGFLKATSIGGWALEASDDELLKLPGQKGPTVTRWTVREASICAIGANHQAIALYDRETNERINLSDPGVIIKLLGLKGDTLLNNNSTMSSVKKILKLSDAASDDAVAEAVQGIMNERNALQAENATLKGTNKTLGDRIALIDAETKATQDAEAIRLTDAAIRDGRLNGTNRQAWLDDFGKDYAGAKVRLSSIPERRPIAGQVEKPAGGSPGAVQLADMTFQEVVKADRLKELKANNALYVEKFRDAYGHEPA